METVEEVKQEGRTRVHQVEKQVREESSASEELVRNHPALSTLIAAGIGFLIAQLPARTLAVGLFKAIVFLLKPAAVLYALSKLIEDSSAHRQFPE